MRKSKFDFDFFSGKKIRFTCFSWMLMVFGFLNSTDSFSQPDGMKVFDRFGNYYPVDSIRITKQGLQRNSTVTCTAGFFNLVFTDQGATGFNNAVNGSLFRNVACSVFSDLSQLLIPANNPYTGLPNTAPFVNINLHMYYGSNPLIAGLGTSYYNEQNYPLNAPGFNKGLVDGEVWKTINGGFDSYLAHTNYFTYDQFYHGEVVVNFNPGFTWNLDYSIPTPATDVDLYTVVLHEAIHMLGFASFLSATGTSTLAGSNFYTRYDSHLNIDSSGTLVPIINNPQSCDSVTYSGVTFPIGCNTRYVGTTNEPVTAGNPYSAGQSFLHFEENCPPGIPYVMCNGGPPGTTRRHPVQEDVYALCDLHYHITSTYGLPGSGFDNYMNTYIACGNRVAGVNDIFHYGTPNLYTYTDCPGQAPISMNDFLHNDEDESSAGNNPVSYDCLAIMAGNGIITNTTATSFDYHTVPGFNGWSVIRYIPVGSNGQRGNLTYIYILTMPCSDCDSACNIVEFGDFEAINNSYLMPMSNFRITDSNSPDLFGWNGSNWVVYPTAWPSTTWGVGCNGSSIAVLPSWNGIGNNRYGGMAGVTTQNVEGMSFRLCDPLIPGNQYTLKFHAATVIASCWGEINFYTSEYAPCMPGSGAINFTGSNDCNGSVTPYDYTLITTQMVSDSGSGWHQFTIPFTYNPVAGSPHANYLTLSLTPVNFPSVPYVFIDDISIPCSPHSGLSLIGNSTNNISVYPNPANDLLNIKITDHPDESFKIILANTFGQILKEKEFNSKKNSDEIQFVLKELPAGIYFLTVNSNNSKRVFKVLKL